MAFSPAFITSNSNGANTNTHTYTGISFPAGKVVVGLYAGFQSPGGVLASVTINGVAGTLRQSAPTFDGASVCELYEADVSAGTGTVVISANSGKNIIRSIIGVWNVVDGVYVTGATNTASTDSPLDVSVNTSSGDAIIVFACRSTGTPSFTPTGYTENFEHLVDTTRGATGGLKTGSSGGTPETFTVSTGGATKNAGVSVVYQAAATGNTLTAAGTSTVTMLGQAVKQATVAAAGTSTFNPLDGTSGATNRTLTAAGTSTVTMLGQSVKQATATIAGTSTVTMLGQAVKQATVAAAGTSTFNPLNGETPAGSKTLTAAGTSTVTMLGQAIKQATVAAAGTSTVTMLGGQIKQATVVIAGTSIVAFGTRVRWRASPQNSKTAIRLASSLRELIIADSLRQITLKEA